MKFGREGEGERGSVGDGSVSDGMRKETVVVGVKLDTPSKELLTWSLVKVAHPGDRIVAAKEKGKLPYFLLLRLLNPSSLSTKASVDLKLKICRGSSVRKVLVQEAKYFEATKVIVGVAKNQCGIRSSASVAKYCGRKLPPDCWILAVNNGKVVFQRESVSISTSPDSGNKNEDCHRHTRFFGAIHRTWSKNSKAVNGKSVEFPHVTAGEIGKNADWEDHRSSVAESDYSEIATDSYTDSPTCSICAPNSTSLEQARCPESAEGSSDSSLALVPGQTLEAASSSISLLIQEMPELRPGWALLRRSIFPNRQNSRQLKANQVSVVQWAMKLPPQHSAAAVHPDHKPEKLDPTTVEVVQNNTQYSGAMVPVGNITSLTLDDNGKGLPKELESLYEKCSSTCKLFSYQELVPATSNFSSGKLIGKGGSSQVYRGCFPDGKELAVKILKASADAMKEFVSEIEIITSLCHKNIISLVGFCFEDEKLLLVYDFLARGSLDENLHGKKNQRILCWSERYKVAVGVAEALDYLHSGSSQPIIHRDVKSSNILLSDDLEPRLADFGLASLASTSSSHITYSDVAGTFGYLAPEYFMYGKVNDKIDVYAFGVVLLELLTGRKPISNEYPKGQESLVMWAKPILQSSKATQLLDPSLGDNYDNNQMEKIILAASLCLRRTPRFRPRMGLILKLLQGDDEVTKWARLQVSTSGESDALDDDTCPADIQSHLNLALLDVEDDSLSVSSTEPSLRYLTANKSWVDYLQGRWSRSGSFD
ncbi:hypothetical protein ACLOJK_014012 [Asimina triloba]